METNRQEKLLKIKKQIILEKYSLVVLKVLRIQVSNLLQIQISKYRRKVRKLLEILY